MIIKIYWFEGAETDSENDCEDQDQEITPSYVAVTDSERQNIRDVENATQSSYVALTDSDDDIVELELIPVPAEAENVESVNENQNSKPQSRSRDDMVLAEQFLKQTKLCFKPKKTGEN